MKLGRNDPCSCGSGKKYKNCCLGKAGFNPPRSSAPASDEINQLDALFSSGRYMELESRARSLLMSYPDSGVVWKLLGLSLQMQGKDALPAMQKAAALLPNDAEAHGNLAAVLRTRGLLEAAVASGRRALQIRPEFAGGHNNLGVALQDLGRLDEAVASYRRALQIRPDFAEAHNNLGGALKNIGQLDGAADSYRRATHFKPDFAEAHNNLGGVLQELGQLDSALASCHRALELNPIFADAHNNLGTILQSLGQPDEALASYRKAVEIKPGYVEAHNNLGFALKELGQFDAALTCFRRALEIKPDYAEAHINLGFTLLLIGRFAEGWREYWWHIPPQDRLNYPVLPLPDNPLFTRKPGEFLPSSLQGMRLTILGDQGLGDELFFLGFAKELKKRGAWLAYATDPRLAPFILRAKWVDSLVEKGAVIGDSHAVLLVSDLPLVLGMTTMDDIPPHIPLEVLPEKRQEIALRLASHRKEGRPLIGITWRAGGDKHKKQMAREIPLEQLAVALREKQATFVVIQRNPQPGEIAAFESALGQPVLNFSDLNNDLEGMLALMEQLDDYVGIYNTNFPLRASVGKTARMLVPHLQDFRCMGTGDRSPWYPGFTIYRRDADSNWGNALEQLKSHLL